MNDRQGNRGTTATLEGHGDVPAGWAVDRPPAARRGRPWRLKGALYKGLLTLSVATFLGTGLLVSPIGVSPVAAAGSGDIDQCANDPAPSSPANGCATNANEWVNGNLNASKSVFREGDSIPYRIKFGGIPTGGVSNTVTIEWDTTKGGKHALDYITAWNASVLDANPCLGVAGCVLGTNTTFPIPVDPQVSGAGVTQIPGVFAMWGGTITAVTPYFYSNGTGFAGDKMAGITLTFTATVANPVLAWGGHIATRQDWGNNNSAVGITGSPYHTRILEVNGSGGNQDRSLKEDAVIFPSTITIIKDVPGTNPQNFAFTASGGLVPASFTLDDDADGSHSNTQLFSDIEVFGNYDFTETLPTGWQLTNRQCVVSGESGGSISNITNGVRVNLVEGQDVTCTFTNTETPNPSLNVTKTANVDSVDAAGDVIDYTIVVFNTGNVTLTGVSVVDPLLTGTLDCNAGLAGQQTTGLTIPVTGSITCTGSYTVTQADIDNNGGGDGDIDNTVTADSNETGPDTAIELVLIERGASLNITKDASVPGGTANVAGEQISYVITVANTGNVTLTNVVVTDPYADAGSIVRNATDVVGDEDNLLEVGETWGYTAVHTVTQAELDSNGGGNGLLENTATADSDQTGPDTDDANVPVGQSPALNITKDASVPGGTANVAGEQISYVITVANTGNVTLTNVVVTDPYADAGSIVRNATDVVGDEDNLLEVGETWGYTAVHTVTQAELDSNGGGNGLLENTATADSDQTGPDTDDANVPVGQSPALNITKDASVPGGTANVAGEQISYVITVANTGNVTLTNVVVTDPYADAGSIVRNATDVVGDEDNLLEVGETWGYTAVHTVTQAELDSNGGGNGLLENTATADSDQTGPDTDDANVPVGQSPALNITKDASVPGGTANVAGEQISYVITVANTGNVTLTNVVVTDPYADAGSIVRNATDVVGDEDNLLEVGETWGYTAVHTVTQAELDSNGGGNGLLENTATADSDQTGPDTDDANVPVGQSPALNITKDASVPGGTANVAGEQISYVITVANTGNVTLTNVVVTDPYADAGSIVRNATDVVGDEDNLLEVGETWGYTAVHTVTQAELDSNGGGNGLLENTATADSDQTGPDTDDANVPVGQSPALNITKDVNDVDGDTSDPVVNEAGDIITYTITVQNTGNVTLTNVVVTDPYATTLTRTATDVVGDEDNLLEVGETWGYTATHTVTQAEIDSNGGGNGQLENTAVADSDQTEPDTDDATVPLVQNPALVVDKEDDGQTFDSLGDVISYTITVTNTGNVTLTNVAVTDALAVGLDCNPLVEGAQTTGFTILVGEHITCTASHTVTQADLDAGSYLNTACADDGAGGAASDCDDETTPGDQNPALVVDKEDDGQTFDSLGDVISYTITVTNTGNVTLTNVAVTDALAVGLDCNPLVEGAQTTGFTILVGEHITCTASHTVTQADLDAGSYLNTACADDGAGGAASDCDDETTPGDQNPALVVDKEDDGQTFDSLGDVISYTITVTNTGNVTLTNVAVTDALAVGLDCNPLVEGAQTTGFTILVGEHITCTASHTVTQADLDAGSYLNTACADDGAGGAASDCDDETTPGDQNPALVVDKEDDGQTFDSLGDVISYTITVTNTGNVTLTNVAVTDALAVGLDCNPLVEGAQTTGFTILVGEHITCTASHTVTQADLDAGSYLNTACADDGAGGAASDCDDETTPGDQNPALVVDKEDDGQTFDSLGDVISYTITVTNTGNVTLTNVAVTDALAVGLDCNPLVEGAQTTGFTILVGEHITCTASHTVTQADLDAGSYLNTACADDGAGGAASDCDDETTPGDQNPELTTLKVDDGQTYDAVGDVIDYTITVTNTGNVTLHDVAVTDALAVGLDCDAGLAGNQTTGFTVAVGAWITCTASHTVTQADLDAGSYLNTACADDGEGGADEHCDSVETPSENNPILAITKVAAESIYTATGQVIHYTIIATNIGNVTLHNVVVTDTQVTDLDCEPDLPVASLAVGATITCTASHTIVQADLDAGFFFNEACVDDGEGGADGVCDDVTVPGQQAGGETDIPTQPPTDGSLGGGGNAGPAGNAWLLVIGLGMVLAVTVLLTPNRKRKEVKNS